MIHELSSDTTNNNNTQDHDSLDTKQSLHISTRHLYLQLVILCCMDTSAIVENRHSSHTTIISVMSWREKLHAIDTI